MALSDAVTSRLLWFQTLVLDEAPPVQLWLGEDLCRVSYP